jgi:hypothetical protein
MQLFARLHSILVLFLASAICAVAFEGRITFEMKSSKKNESVSMTQVMKNGLVRMEPQMAEAKGAAMIFNWEKKVMIILMPEQRMYMTMPLKMPQTAQAVKADKGPVSKPEKTGRTDTILGYSCDEYVTKGAKGEVVSVWITDKLGAFMGLSGGNPMMGGRGRGGDDNSWEQAVKGMENFFPLRVVIHDASGKQTFTMETTKIDVSPVDDSQFSPPEGYQSFAMPGMPGMG